MTMLPEAPAIAAYLHSPERPLAYTRPGDGYGWFLIDRESRCLIHVRGPFETKEEVLAVGRERQASRTATYATPRTLLDHPG